jgi:hypothetical protein
MLKHRHIWDCEHNGNRSSVSTWFNSLTWSTSRPDSYGVSVIWCGHHGDPIVFAELAALCLYNAFASTCHRSGGNSFILYVPIRTCLWVLSTLLICMVRRTCNTDTTEREREREELCGTVFTSVWWRFVTLLPAGDQHIDVKQWKCEDMAQWRLFMMTVMSLRIP